MDLGLRGKLALITGGSKGIGYACAEAFLREGATVALAARDPATLAAAARALEKAHGVRPEVHAADLSKPGAAEALAAAVPAPDILVNNAGAVPGGDILAIDEAQWRAAWDLKVFGYINVTRAVLKGMMARGSGVVVNVIGLAGERPEWNYAAGCAGNAALMHLTKALGGASVDKGVRVVAVNPALTETDRMVTLMRTRAQAELGDAERWREIVAKAKLPFGRAAKPSEVADLVAFLASERAGYISGTVYAIDGGKAARPGT